MLIVVNTNTQKDKSQISYYYLHKKSTIIISILGKNIKKTSINLSNFYFNNYFLLKNHFQVNKI